MINFPRLDILLVSACHIDAVAVFIPVPTPATILPTIIWLTEKEEDWIIAPMAMIMLPIRIWRGRPKISPVHIVEMDPTKAPMVYKEAIVPWTLAEGYPIVVRKFSPMMTFPNTPCRSQIRSKIFYSQQRLKSREETHLVISVEDQDSGRCDRDPHGQRVAGTSQVYSTHVSIFIVILAYFAWPREGQGKWKTMFDYSITHALCAVYNLPRQGAAGCKYSHFPGLPGHHGICCCGVDRFTSEATETICKLIWRFLSPFRPFSENIPTGDDTFEGPRSPMIGRISFPQAISASGGSHNFHRKQRVRLPLYFTGTISGGIMRLSSFPVISCRV
jgi:hypothetical protein